MSALHREVVVFGFVAMLGVGDVRTAVAENGTQEQGVAALQCIYDLWNPLDKAAKPIVNTSSSLNKYCPEIQRIARSALAVLEDV